MISFVLTKLKRLRSLSFFYGGHGKSACDRHFGSLAAPLEAGETDIIHLQDAVARIQTVPNTKAVYHRIKKKTMKLTNLVLPGLTSINCFLKHKGKILVGQYADSAVHHMPELQKKTVAFTYKFVPKISDKLPMVPGEKLLPGDCIVKEDKQDSDDDHVGELLANVIAKTKSLKRKHGRVQYTFDTLETKAKKKK